MALEKVMDELLNEDKQMRVFSQKDRLHVGCCLEAQDECRFGRWKKWTIPSQSQTLPPQEIHEEDDELRNFLRKPTRFVLRGRKSSRHSIERIYELLNGFGLGKVCKTKNVKGKTKIEKVSESISERLTGKNIVRPTEIQEKAMLQVLNGHNVILNSETGSGKTLCYLLPILEQLKNSQKTFQDKIISSSCAMIFAPTLELAEQIGSVCNELGETEISIACGRSPLRVTDTTRVIVTIPSVIMNYDWKSLKNIKCLVFDEADSMLVEKFAEVRKILEFYTGRKTYFSRKERKRQLKKAARRKYVFSTAPEQPQFVFVGATIPSGGSKTALSLIEKFVPSSSLIQSSATHRVVPRTEFEFIDVMDDFQAKVVALAKVLESEIACKYDHADSSNVITTNKVNSELTSSEEFLASNFRAIVYTNKVSDAKRLYEELVKDDKRMILGSKYVLYGDSILHGKAGAKTRQLEETMDVNAKHSAEERLPVEEELGNQENREEGRSDNSYYSTSEHSPPTIDLSNLREFRMKWKNRFRTLHSGMTSFDRLAVLNEFAHGNCNVLVTTNVASRGLDIPNVDVIVQFDFASDVAAMLHRAGRTARAGAEGKVISFVAEKNKDLCQLFRSSVNKDEDISTLFSRRRRLRQKIKKGSLHVTTVENIIENN
eukprot:gene19172-21093_t